MRKIIVSLSIVSLSILLMILLVVYSQQQNPTSTQNTQQQNPTSTRNTQQQNPTSTQNTCNQLKTNNPQIVYSDANQCAPICSSGKPYDVNCLISVANYESLCSKLKPQNSPIDTLSDGFSPNGFSPNSCTHCNPNPNVKNICSFSGDNGQIGYCFYKTNQIPAVQPVPVYPSMGGFNVCLLT